MSRKITQKSIFLSVLALAISGGILWQWPLLKQQIPWLQQASSGEKNNAGPPPNSIRGGSGMMGGMPNNSIPVRLSETKIGNFSFEIKALGTVQAANTVSVKPRVSGELLKVSFDEGQLVKAGQLLAQIDPRFYQAALDKAESSLLERRAELKNAELDLKRYQNLHTEDSIAKQTLDAQLAKVEQLRGSLKGLEAQVTEARLNLDFTHVRAPIAGRLGLRQVDQGNLVSAGDSTPLVTITQTTPISVNFTVPESALPSVLARYRAGEPLVVEAWDRSERQRLASGMLLSVDNQIDTSTGTVRLKARFENNDETLFPNQFVNVRLLVEQRTDALLLPSAAIQTGVHGAFVYLITPENKATIRPVNITASNGENSLINEGLSAGDRVVLEGIDRLKEGSSVEIVEGAFKPAARPTGKAPQ